VRSTSPPFLHDDIAWAQLSSVQEYDRQFDMMGDHPESDDQPASDNGNDDEDDEDEDDMILAASSRLAHDVCCYPTLFRRLQLILQQAVFDKPKRVKGPPTNIKRGPFGQVMAEQDPAVTTIRKGKEKARETTAHYGYGNPPSSLSAGQSSATWLSRPSEDLDQPPVSSL